MKALRLVLYFVLGFMLAVAAGAASAMNLQLGRYYNSAAGGASRAYVPRGSPTLGTLTEATTAANQANYKINVPISRGPGYTIAANDAFSVAKSAFLPDVLDLAKKGFKSGPFLLGGLCLLVCDQLLQGLKDKGYEWMEDARCQVSASCWVNKPYGAIPYDANKDTTVCGPLWYPCFTIAHANFGRGAYASQLSTFYAQVCKGSGWDVYYGDGAHCYRPVPWDWANMQFSVVNTATPNQPRPTTIVSDSDINAAASTVLDEKFPQIATAAFQDGQVFNMPDSTVVVPSTQPMYPQDPVTTTETTTNPDGSTTTKTKSSVTTITPDIGKTIADPITTTSKTTTSESTRTCAAGGTGCTQTDTTKQEQSNPQQQQKTDCQLNPKAAGCIELGTPSSADVPKETRSSSFSYTALSLNATCPADLSITLAGRPFKVSFSYLCQFASAIRAMVLLCAFVAAYFIMFGGRRADE